MCINLCVLVCYFAAHTDTQAQTRKHARMHAYTRIHTRTYAHAQSFINTYTLSSSSSASFPVLFADTTSLNPPSFIICALLQTSHTKPIFRHPSPRLFYNWLNPFEGALLNSTYLSAEIDCKSFSVSALRETCEKFGFLRLESTLYLSTRVINGPTHPLLYIYMNEKGGRG